MQAFVISKPANVRRLVQPAGSVPVSRTPRWTDGMAVRLPGRRLFVIAYGLPSRRKAMRTFG